MTPEQIDMLPTPRTVSLHHLVCLPYDIQTHANNLENLCADLERKLAAAVMALEHIVKIKDGETMYMTAKEAIAAIRYNK